MILRTLVLLATLMSVGSIQAQRNTPQALSQFTMDVILNIGMQNGLDTLNKYRDSDQFYITEKELFNVGQILFRQGMKDDAILFMNSVSKDYPNLNKSLAQHVFKMLLEVGVEQSQKWLDANYNYKGYYLDEGEFDMATTTLLRANSIPECKVLNTIYLNEFPDNQEAHFQMADIHDALGNEQLAMQYFRSGVETEDYVSFSKLACDPLSIYVPTVLPRDTTKLFIAEGEMDKDTAWVFVQGGPMPDISAYNPRPLTLLPNHESLLKIDVLQSQMINRSILSADIPLTNEQNLFEHNLSAEMLYRTVKYLKDRGKTVFVIGHSYGAYISYDYLYSKRDLSDQLIIMASDLDEDIRNYEMNEDGSRKFIRYRDGVTPYETTFWGGFTMERVLKPKLNKIFTNTGSLVASHGKRRFTELLKGKDLSNVIFYHAKFDEANGRTTKSEIDFWHAHGAQTIESYGDHHSMLSNDVFSNIYDFLSKGKPLKRSIASALAYDILELGVDAAIEKCKKNVDDDKFFSLVESEINTLGYKLVATKKLDQALKVFQLNVEFFPESWNVYDSLAETHLALGETVLSKVNYEKSLEMHPGNIYAIMALQQL